MGIARAGSSPVIYPLWRNSGIGLTRYPFKVEIAGSIPAYATRRKAVVACENHNLVVDGSIPSSETLEMIAFLIFEGGYF